MGSEHNDFGLTKGDYNRCSKCGEQRGAFMSCPNPNCADYGQPQVGSFTKRLAIAGFVAAVVIAVLYWMGVLETAST